MSTYLGQKGYTVYKECLEVSEQELIRKELTVVPFIPKSSPVKATPFPVYRESAKKLYMPRFYGNKHYGEAHDIRLSQGDNININFAGKLRPQQEAPVKAFLKAGNGLLELHCGFGKTCLALYIASVLKKKTLVIVHKSFLMNQWRSRIEQFIPEARIGRIQGEVVDIEDKDIVLGMLQSLSMKEYPASVFESFGLTICDECHHLSSEVFSRALFKIVTKHMLGLSATMKRKDGLSRVFQMFLGKVVYKKANDNYENVLVRVINYSHPSEEYNQDVLNFRGQVNYSSMIKKLCEFEPRSNFILDLLKMMFEEKEDQQIIILGHNKNLLSYLFDKIVERKLASVGYYIGGMKESALLLSETKKIIVATYAMAAEGLDIKTLTTLVMVTPKTDVKQSVGRILRKRDGYHLVVDIVDSHAIFHRQWLKRRAFYRKHNYTIKMIEANNYANGEWIEHTKKKKKNEKLQIGKCLISD